MEKNSLPYPYQITSRVRASKVEAGGEKMWDSCNGLIWVIHQDSSHHRESVSPWIGGVQGSW